MDLALGVFHGKSQSGDLVPVGYHFNSPGVPNHRRPSLLPTNERGWMGVTTQYSCISVRAGVIKFGDPVRMGIPGPHSHGKMGFPGSPFYRYIGDPFVRMGIPL